MERREFVGASVATLCSATAGSSAEPKPESSEVFELRTYLLKPAKQALLDDYLAHAFIPAVKRLGLGPVGAFTEAPEKDRLKLTVLIVYPSADRMVSLPAQLSADADYLKAAKAYRDARPDDPVYQRIESSLVVAIPGLPKLERPDASKPRLFNLRVYESHNERAAAKKVEMFEKGELAIFRRDGLTPVFFASARIGAALPNLTYMLVFPDEAARGAAWTKFRDDPSWLKLKAMPEYADAEIVSHITNRILMPTAYSEI